MKLLMVINMGKDSRKNAALEIAFQANIDNSLSLGWAREDIIVLSNIDLSFMGITTKCVPLNKSCFTGSKMYGLKWLFDNRIISDNEIIWAKDADCWQNSPLIEPKFKDVGAAYYSQPKFNGGSIFWRPTAQDIVEEIVSKLSNEQLKREEPTLNKVFKSQEYRDRVAVLNYTYNVGCSGYFERFTKSLKPVQVCHFHPDNKTAWETHCLDRNGIGEKGISAKLEKLLRKYYPGLAIELSEKGKQSALEKQRKREEKGIIY